MREVTTTVEMLNDIAQAVKRRDASELEVERTTVADGNVTFSDNPLSI